MEAPATTIAQSAPAATVSTSPTETPTAELNVSWTGDITTAPTQTQSENVVEQLLSQSQTDEDSAKYQFQRLRNALSDETFDKNKLATEIANYEEGFKKVYLQKQSLEQEMATTREQVSEIVNAITPLSQAMASQDVNGVLNWLAANGLDIRSLLNGGAPAANVQNEVRNQSQYETQTPPPINMPTEAELRAQELAFKYEVTPKIVQAVKERVGWEITPSMVEVAYRAFPDKDVLEALSMAYPQEWQRFQEQKQATAPNVDQLRMGEKMVSPSSGRNPFNRNTHPRQYTQWELMNN